MRSNMFFGNNVFILGAGFSVDAGMPLLKDFMSRMRDVRELSNDLPEEAKSAIDTVLEERASLSNVRDKVKLNLDNVEDLFSLIEAHTSTSTRSKAKVLKVAIRRAISATLLYSSQKKPTLDLQIENGAVEEPIRKLAEISGQSNFGSSNNSIRLNTYILYAALISHILDDSDDMEGYSDTIITFNYDLVLEESLAYLKIRPNYCIQNVEYNSMIPTTDAPRVIKVHGSVNWYDSGHGHLTVVDDPKELLTTPGKMPLLLPPTWSKTTQSRISVQSWGAAVSALEKAHRIFLIGYSIPEGDAYFKYMLAAGLRNNCSLRQFLVINPAKHIENAVKSILDYTYFENRLIIPSYEQSVLSKQMQYYHSIKEKFGRGRRLAGQHL